MGWGRGKPEGGTSAEIVLVVVVGVVVDLGVGNLGGTPSSTLLSRAAHSMMFMLAWWESICGSSGN